VECSFTAYMLRAVSGVSVAEGDGASPSTFAIATVRVKDRSHYARIRTYV